MNILLALILGIMLGWASYGLTIKYGKGRFVREPSFSSDLLGRLSYTTLLLFHKQVEDEIARRKP